MPYPPAALIARYDHAYADLCAALAEFDSHGLALRHFKPAPQRWSIHEIVVHLADSEANSYIRLRRLVAEPGSQVLGYLQDTWCAKLSYAQQDFYTALQTFRWLRQSSAELLPLVPEAVWDNVVIHSESGHYSMRAWLDIYTDHVEGHIHQMRGNLAAWKAVGRPGV